MSEVIEFKVVLCPKKKLQYCGIGKIEKRLQRRDYIYVRPWRTSRNWQKREGRLQRCSMLRGKQVQRLTQHWCAFGRASVPKPWASYTQQLQRAGCTRWGCCTSLILVQRVGSRSSMATRIRINFWCPCSYHFPIHPESKDTYVQSNQQ